MFLKYIININTPNNLFSGLPFSKVKRHVYPLSKGTRWNDPNYLWAKLKGKPLFSIDLNNSAGYLKKIKIYYSPNFLANQTLMDLDRILI